MRKLFTHAVSVLWMWGATVAGGACAEPEGREVMDLPGAGMTEEVSRAAQPVTSCPRGGNLLTNAGFDTAASPASTRHTSVVGASSYAPSAAASWTLWMNYLGDIATKHMWGVSGAHRGAIRVYTTRQDGGIVQVFDAHHRGPLRVRARAWVYVVSGTVGLAVGNGGNGGYVASTSTEGDWQLLEGENLVSPANEVAVYATSPEGAEFYVDEVSIEALECGLSSTDAWAFLWAHGISGRYVADRYYSASSISAGGWSATVDWRRPGMAVVELPGMGTEEGGSIQVNAYGPGSERCKVGRWAPSGSGLEAVVLCTTPDGTPVNTQFVLSYVRKRSPSAAPGGYVWVDEPSRVEYVPSMLHQWNSSGELNVVRHDAPGVYSVRFPGIFVNGGTALVTAYGEGGGYCGIGGWGSDVVTVYCYDTAGTLADQRFVLNFSEAWPVLGRSYAYAWANDAWSPRYQPVPWYQRNVLGPPSWPATLPALWAGRHGPGSYLVDIPELSQLNSNALVSAYDTGAGGAYCKPRMWTELSGSRGTQVQVQCFDPAGNPTDSQYDLVYTNLEDIHG